MSPRANQKSDVSYREANGTFRTKRELTSVGHGDVADIISRAQLGQDVDIRTTSPAFIPGRAGSMDAVIAKSEH